MGLLRHFSKAAGQIWTRTIDFAGDLAAGETIVSATCTTTNRETGADTSNTMKVNPATPPVVSVDGQRVTQKFTGGVEGETHVVEMIATTTSGHTPRHSFWIEIREGKNV